MPGKASEAECFEETLVDASRLSVAPPQGGVWGAVQRCGQRSTQKIRGSDPAFGSTFLYAAHDGGSVSMTIDEQE